MLSADFVREIFFSNSMQTPTNKYNFATTTERRVNGARLLTVLDWDDTIMPTKDIVKHDGEMKLPRRYISIAASVLELLLDLCADDGLIILTSSTEGWVEQSCAAFAPELTPLLERARIVHTPKATRQLGLKQKCPAVVKLVNEFSRTGTGSDEDSLEILLLGNMPGDVEPAKALRTLYPGVSVKTCLLKEVPTLLELERQLFYLLHSLIGLMNDNGEVDDYTIAQAAEFAEIDEYSEECALRRATLTATAAVEEAATSTGISKSPEHSKPQKHGYRRRSLVCEA